MNIFEYALKLERDGEQYYRQMEAKSSNPGLKKILTMLADEEVKHYEALLKLQANQKDVTLSVADVVGNAKATFAAMAKSGESYDFEKQEVDMYRKAAEIEDNAQQFYASKATEARNPSEKAILERLAGEESKHSQLLNGLADFVTRPSTWLEDAEWTHIEEY